MSKSFDLLSYDEALMSSPVTDENRSDESVLKWSGDFPIPIIGEKVLVTMNDLGPGIVEAYKRMHGFVGVIVKLSNPPRWYLDNCSGFNHPAVFFGTELRKSTIENK